MFYTILKTHYTNRNIFLTLCNILSNRVTFQCEVYLCNWHVRRAWIKSLVMKVKDAITRRSMFKRLGNIMHNHKNVDSALEEANMFLNEFKEENAFVEYF